MVPNKAKLIRKTPTGNQEIPLALRDMLASKSPDVRLQAGDIIFVPRSPSKSARKPQNADFYDVPPSAPLQDAAPIYIR